MRGYDIEEFLTSPNPSYNRRRNCISLTNSQFVFCIIRMIRILWFTKEKCGRAICTPAGESNTRSLVSIGSGYRAGQKQHHTAQHYDCRKKNPAPNTFHSDHPPFLPGPTTTATTATVVQMLCITGSRTSPQVATQKTAPAA